jgi:DNA (cytosine-5)-methyltransferase 1
MPAQAYRKNPADVEQCGARKRADGALRFKAASLFSGIGGFDIDLERAGFDITFQCEINKFCRSILKRHWPQIPYHENIKELHATDIPQSDVWTGGFPCQDVSLARMGARAGLRGKRSGLFYDFARLIENAESTLLWVLN